MGILTTVGFKYAFPLENKDQIVLTAFMDNNKRRFNELYDKSLIWVNWYYSNNWVTKPDYLKIYCDNVTKTIKAYICDSTNSIDDATFRNCIQIDYPDFNFLTLDWKTSDYSSMYAINSCIYRQGAWAYTNGSFYAKMNLNFPYGTKLYWENAGYTKANEADDFEVDDVKLTATKNNRGVDFSLYTKN
jgi:hypothetical protein